MHTPAVIMEQVHCEASGFLIGIPATITVIANKQYVSVGRLSCLENLYAVLHAQHR